jgi:hypothetical protein
MTTPETPATDGFAAGWPEEHMLEAAWGLLANSGAFDHPEMASPGWKPAAERWRDAYMASVREQLAGDADV